MAAIGWLLGFVWGAMWRFPRFFMVVFGLVALANAL
jgi:hypothetical protein